MQADIKSRTAGWPERWWLGTLYAVAGFGGLAAGVGFGLQAGGGTVLAVLAGLCMTLFCTILVDALADRLKDRPKLQTKHQPKHARGSTAGL